MSSGLNATGGKDAVPQAEVDADAVVRGYLEPQFREASRRDGVAALFLLAAGLVYAAGMTQSAPQNRDGQQMHRPAPEKLLPAILEEKRGKLEKGH